MNVITYQPDAVSIFIPVISPTINKTGQCTIVVVRIDKGQPDLPADAHYLENGKQRLCLEKRETSLLLVLV